MKKRACIAFLTMVIMILSAIFVSADEGSLKLLSTYPKNGQKNTSVENVGVKLKFNNSVSSDSVRENNIRALKIVNKETGEKLPIKIIFSKNKKGLVLVLGDNSDGKLKVSNNSEYKLIIDESFSDDDGNILGKKKELNFTTFNQKLNNTINMAMMFVMFGGIAFFTIRQQKKAGQEDKEEEKTKKESINPYKEAKRTGKTVEEIVANEKEKEKKKEKKKKKGKPEEIHDKKEINLSEILPYVHHVKEPRPISAAGGKYKRAEIKSGK